MKGHGKKGELAEILTTAQRFGCRVENRGNKFAIFPPNKNVMPYMAHNCETAAHPVRRYLKNQCGFAI
jgi:hypothetical protein